MGTHGGHGMVGMDKQRKWATWVLGTLMMLASIYTLFLPVHTSASPLEQTAESTSFVNPYITPSPAGCPNTQGMRTGDIAVLTGGVVIRYAPDPSAPYIVTFPENREFTITGDPVCFAGFHWYPIAGHGVRGWASEGTTNGRRVWLRLVRRAGEPAIPCETPQKLVVGERFDISNNVRMRDIPSLLGRTLTVVPNDAQVIVLLDKPTCAEGINWWKVRATVVNVVYDGWIAESLPAGDPFVVVPTSPPCHAPLALDIGEQARVIYNDTQPKRLRSMPTTRGTVLVDLIENVPLLLLDGPVCADSYNWWKVRVLTSNPIEGWLAEGGPANYWIAPISDFREP